MRNQTTCSVPLFSSVYILTAGLSEVDCMQSNSLNQNPVNQNQEVKFLKSASLPLEIKPLYELSLYEVSKFCTYGQLTQQ